MSIHAAVEGMFADFLKRELPWCELVEVKVKPHHAVVVLRRKRWAKLLGTVWWRFTRKRAYVLASTALANVRPIAVWISVHIER